MSAQYKKNNFSTESLPTSYSTGNNKKKIKVKPNIDYLMKRIIDEKKQEQKKITILVWGFFSMILIFYFFQN